MSAAISIWAGQLPVSRMDGRDLAYCRCGAEGGHLTRRIAANGSVQLRWRCDGCGDFSSFSHLPHRFLEGFGVALEDLPVCFDGRDFSTPCVICGDTGTEWHHWAPSSIFPWEEFPQWSDVGAYLCVAHHREWHATMRAHGLRYPHELAAEAV